MIATSIWITTFSLTLKIWVQLTRCRVIHNTPGKWEEIKKWVICFGLCTNGLTLIMLQGLAILNGFSNSETGTLKDSLVLHTLKSYLKLTFNLLFVQFTHHQKIKYKIQKNSDQTIGCSYTEDMYTLQAGETMCQNQVN